MLSFHRLNDVAGPSPSRQAAEGTRCVREGCALWGQLGADMRLHQNLSTISSERKRGRVRDRVAKAARSKCHYRGSTGLRLQHAIGHGGSTDQADARDEEAAALYVHELKFRNRTTAATPFTLRSARVLWDMIDGPMPRGVLGIGSGDLASGSDRTVLCLGGYSTTFRNRLDAATADASEPLSGTMGTIQTGRSRRAHALVPDPPRSAWDRGGMHTPSFPRRQQTPHRASFAPAEAAAATSGPAAATQSAFSNTSTVSGDERGPLC